MNHRDAPFEASRRRGRLEELYLRHAPGALRLAYLLTGNREVAEDLVHDAFVKVTRRLTHLRQPAAFGAYFRKALINLVNSHYRRRRLEQAFLRREARQPHYESRQPDIGTRDEFRRMLLRLPPRQRSALVLRFYEDLSVRETAVLLGCRPGTVKALVAQGIGTLREVLENE